MKIGKLSAVLIFKHSWGPFEMQEVQEVLARERVIFAFDFYFELVSRSVWPTEFDIWDGRALLTANAVHRSVLELGLAKANPTRIFVWQLNFDEAGVTAWNPTELTSLLESN